MIYKEERLVELDSLINKGIKNNNKRLHTALPAIILEFDTETQLAKVQPAIKLLLTTGEIELPILADVPVTFARAGGFSITFPVKKGDECLLLFAEKSIDRWKKDGHGHQATQVRNHDITDAIAILGLYCQKNTINNFSNEDLEIKADDNSCAIKVKADKSLQLVANNANISINNNNIIINNNGNNITVNKSGKVKIENNAGKDVVKIIDELLDKLKAEPQLINIADYTRLSNDIKSFI